MYFLICFKLYYKTAKKRRDQWTALQLYFVLIIRQEDKIKFNALTQNCLWQSIWNFKNELIKYFKE
jgi:hypothetical protein